MEKAFDCLNSYCNMASITSASILVSAILLGSILFQSSFNIPTVILAASNTTKLVGGVAKTTVPPSSSNTSKIHFDKFGIREIYPTKPIGGREWFINMSSPLNDKNFSLSGGGEGTQAINSSLANASSINGQITKQPDGSYQIYGVRKLGKYDFSVRMNVNTSSAIFWWKNVEITGYAKVVSITSANPALDWFARSGIHTATSPCEGTAYHGGIRTDGNVFWQKEIWHTGGYTDFRGNQNVTHSIIGKWIGFKVIMFNIDNDSAVRLQLYLDDNATNHWRKVTDIVDNGGWYANSPDDYFYSANCGRSKDYIILHGGPYATFRSDNMIWNFKDLSIREIQVPAENSTNTK